MFFQRLPDAALDARIGAVFGGDAESGDAARLLAEVKEATSAAELAAETARKHALDPLLSGDDLKLARREMEDASFLRDRLTEAASRLGERVGELKALEADSRIGAEHERVETERDQLAEEMEGMADPIVQIAHLVSQIEACDCEIGRLNARAALRHGRIPLVLAGATPAITAPISGRLGLGFVHCGREAEVTASCSRRGRREGQIARHAIRQFGSCTLAEVERGAGRSSRSLLLWDMHRVSRRHAD
jgi:hypothetical protein